MDFKLSQIPKQEICKLHKRIGSEIKILRGDNNISQLEMALSIGVRSVAFYSNCENNKNGKHFNVEHIYKICKALKIPLADFFAKIENDTHAQR